ncbi:MAG TPA: hypothetical protein VGN20_23045 [Mucilaginibacter sp.]|jgi:hypothetical protein
MNDDKENELDNFFRKGMEDPVDHNGYREQDWNALEKMLDKGKKRKGIVYWLPVLSGVAALLLLFLGWWALQPKNVKNNQAVKTENDRKQPGNGPVDTPKQPASKGTGSADFAKIKGAATGSADSVTVTKSTNGTADYTKTLKTARSADYANVTNHHNQNTGSKSSAIIPAGVPAGNNVNYPGKEIPNQLSNETLTAVNTGRFLGPTGIDAPSLSSYYINSPAKSAAAKNSAEIKKQAAFRPQYALTFLAAPDINGVGSFQQAQVGTNLGLVFSAHVLKKLSISTGVIYSDKPYSIASGDYHTAYHFPVSPQNISAVCHMLDIPLNVNYQLYSKHQNKIFIGTGLSSYIMLNENYKFNYANSNYYGKVLPSSFTVPHSDTYFFGVANLSATYQRQLNSKIALDVQPYLKLPLTELGYGQVRLQTTGVAVGLTWNLNSLSKH